MNRGGPTAMVVSLDTSRRERLLLEVGSYCPVLYTRDVEDAFAMAERGDLHLIVIDATRDVVAGFGILNRLRATPQNRETLVFFLAAEGVEVESLRQRLGEDERRRTVFLHDGDVLDGTLAVKRHAPAWRSLLAGRLPRLSCDVDREYKSQ